MALSIIRDGGGCARGPHEGWPARARARGPRRARCSADDLQKARGKSAHGRATAEFRQGGVPPPKVKAREGGVPPKIRKGVWGRNSAERARATRIVLRIKCRHLTCDLQGPWKGGGGMALANLIPLRKWEQGTGQGRG